MVDRNCFPKIKVACQNNGKRLRERAWLRGLVSRTGEGVLLSIIVESTLSGAPFYQSH